MVVRFSAALAAMASSVLACGCDDDDDIDEVIQVDLPAQVTYQLTTLVTSATDADLINPWGIAGHAGEVWIADGGTGSVSIFDASGRASGDPPTGGFGLGAGVTGIADVREAGDEASFLIDTDLTCGTNPQTQAAFVVARTDGALIAINDDAGAAGVTVVDRSADGAAYFGVTRVDTANGPLLLAADFANGRIDRFDAAFQLLPASDGAAPFSDPDLPAGYSPWNVMAFGDLVLVAYAAVAAEGEGGVPEEATGASLGRVTVFDTSGAVVARLDSTLLDAPWGFAVREDADDLVCDGDDLVCVNAARGLIYVGNSGDGRITAFDPGTFEAVEQLSAPDGSTIAIEGLWGIAFGDPGSAAADALFFAAGPEDETAGAFGRLDPVVTARPDVLVAGGDDDP